MRLNTQWVPSSAALRSTASSVQSVYIAPQGHVELTEFLGCDHDTAHGIALRSSDVKMFERRSLLRVIVATPQ